MKVESKKRKQGTLREMRWKDKVGERRGEGSRRGYMSSSCKKRGEACMTSSSLNSDMNKVYSVHIIFAAALGRVRLSIHLSGRDCHDGGELCRSTRVVLAGSEAFDRLPDAA